MSSHFTTVDEYIAAQSPEAQTMLSALREAVIAAAPGVEESIRYDIPSYKLNGRPLISLAAWKHHVGLYPVPVQDEELERLVAPLRSAKSTAKLPLNAPYPSELVQRLLASMVARNARLTLK